MKKYIEYKVSYTNDSIDHVSWQRAKKLVSSPSEDIVLIERVTRWWEDDGELVDEEFEILYEKKENKV